MISGIMDGPLLIAFSSNNKSKLSPDKVMTYSFMFSLKDNNDTSIIKKINNTEANNVVIADSGRIKKMLGQILQILYIFTASLDLVTIFILCISLGNLNYISFLNRKYEFGVLSAIGYKKSQLCLKLWKENSLICFAGYVCGIILATLVCYLANLAIWEVNGKHVPLWSNAGIIYALAVPLFVSLFGLLPPIKELRRTDPIEVLGGNI
jgi:putative ABC transport system permease protein